VFLGYLLTFLVEIGMRIEAAAEVNMDFVVNNLIKIYDFSSEIDLVF